MSEEKALSLNLERIKTFYIFVLRMAKWLLFMVPFLSAIKILIWQSYIWGFMDMSSQESSESSVFHCLAQFKKPDISTATPLLYKGLLNHVQDNLFLQNCQATSVDQHGPIGSTEHSRMMWYIMFHRSLCTLHLFSFCLDFYPTFFFHIQIKAANILMLPPPPIFSQQQTCSVSWAF